MQTPEIRRLHQEKMLKGLTHLTAMLWLVILLMGEASIWVEHFVGGYTLMVLVVPLAFLIYVIKKAYIGEDVFPADWAEEAKAAKVQRLLGHVTVGVSVLLVIAWILLVTFKTHVHAVIPFLDWRLLVKMMLSYGFALFVLRFVCGLYIFKRRTVMGVMVGKEGGDVR